MIVRKITSDDMPLINFWWSHHWGPRIPPVHPHMLSSDGYIAEAKGKRVAAAWYGKISNSKTALVEWLVRSPRSNREEAYKAFALIVKEIENQAKEDGFKILIALTHHKNIKKFFADVDYIGEDESLDSYSKILK